MLKGFRDFLLRGSVVDLAVAVVVGAAFNAVVSALVKDIITPFIAAVGGSPDFSAMFFTVNSSRFMIGDFINTVISFVINAAVIYFFIVVPMNRIGERIKRGEKMSPTDKTCPECLSAIPAKANRCRYCTARQR